jgi:hypothetical protein
MVFNADFIQQYIEKITAAETSDLVRGVYNTATDFATVVIAVSLSVGPALRHFILHFFCNTCNVLQGTTLPHVFLYLPNTSPLRKLPRGHSVCRSYGAEHTKQTRQFKAVAVLW